MKTNRVMIFGRPGSGKSTFAYKLHQDTKIPLYHLDKYFFIGNWQKRDNTEFMQDQLNMVNSEAWIIDGNCTKSLETRYKRAQLCLYFNQPKVLCLWRVCKRLFHNRDHFDDRAQDCPEAVRWELVKYLWTFEDRVREKIVQLRTSYPQVQFIEVTNDKQLQELMSNHEQNS